MCTMVWLWPSVAVLVQSVTTTISLANHYVIIIVYTCGMLHTSTCNLPLVCNNNDINQLLRFVYNILARCYVAAKVYKVLYISDTDPPCRAHAHMFTIIQFLRARANIHTVLEG